MTFLIILFSSLILTLAIRKLCFIYNKLDIPNHRSSHAKPKALMGGGAIIIAFYGGLIALSFFHPVLKTIISSIYMTVLLTSGFLLGLIGLIDDLKNLSSKLRFSLHIFITLISAISVFLLSNQTFTLFNLALIILGTIWLIGNLNVYNFMDGIDGIAAGCGIIFSVFFMTAGYLTENYIVFYLAQLLIPAQLGFLILNFPPAKIFMGDVGSTFLGFIFALFSLLLAMDNPINILIGIGLLLPFLFDGGYTIIRRKLNGESIFEAHRKHLYQRLIRSEWSHLKTSFLYYLLALACGVSTVVVANKPLYVVAIIIGYGLVYKVVEKIFVTVEF